MAEKIFFIDWNIDGSELIAAADDFGVKVHCTRDKDGRRQVIISGTSGNCLLFYDYCRTKDKSIIEIKDYDGEINWTGYYLGAISSQLAKLIVILSR